MPKDIKELNTRPEARNLISIYSSLTNTKIEQNIEIYLAKTFRNLKNLYHKFWLIKLSL